MTRQDDSAELPAVDLNARIEAGLREIGSQHVSPVGWQERIWARVREAEERDRRRAERNARWLRALWWFGPIVFVVVGALVAYLCTLAVRP